MDCIYLLRVCLFVCFLATSQSMWDLVPDQGLNLCLLHWKLEDLTTRPPGKSLSLLLIWFPRKSLRVSDMCRFFVIDEHDAADFICFIPCSIFWGVV